MCVLYEKKINVISRNMNQCVNQGFGMEKRINSTVCDSNFR